MDTINLTDTDINLFTEAMDIIMEATDITMVATDITINLGKWLNLHNLEISEVFCYLDFVWNQFCHFESPVLDCSFDYFLSSNLIV